MSAIAVSTFKIHTDCDRAGLGDATFVRNASVAAAGFLNATNTSTAEAPDYVQEFDLGTEFPW